MALNQTNKTRVGCGDLCCFALNNLTHTKLDFG